jgi:hypothetical protein
MVGGRQSYVATLSPAELEAAAARYGVRAAFRGGLTARHHAPLAAFVLALAFASILATTGLISRRSGESAILVAAALFMVQRLAAHRRIWRARNEGRAEVETLLSGVVTTTIDADAVSQASARGARVIAFAEGRDAEEASGLIYVWGPRGAPIVLPSRALPEGEAARLVARLKGCFRSPTP